MIDNRPDINKFHEIQYNESMNGIANYSLQNDYNNHAYTSANYLQGLDNCEVNKNILFAGQSLTTRRANKFKSRRSRKQQMYADSDILYNYVDLTRKIELEQVAAQIQSQTEFEKDIFLRDLSRYLQSEFSDLKPQVRKNIIEALDKNYESFNNIDIDTFLPEFINSVIQVVGEETPRYFLSEFTLDYHYDFTFDFIQFLKYETTRRLFKNVCQQAKKLPLTIYRESTLRGQMIEYIDTICTYKDIVNTIYLSNSNNCSINNKPKTDAKTILIRPLRPTD